MNVLFLNLLSPEKKKRINDLVNFIFVKNLLEIMTFMVTVAGIFVVGGWIVVIGGYNELAESSISINREYGAQNQETREINKILHNINNSAENYAHVADKLDELAKSTPDGIILNLINIDRPGQNISISGNAKDRAALLDYHTILKNISWIAQINSPSSQLFQKENIYFEITGKLKDLPAAGQTVAPKPGAKVRDNE